MSQVSAGVPVSRDLRLPAPLVGLDARTLQEHLAAAWQLTDWLFAGVTEAGSLTRNPDPLRNPLVFYVGHPAAFTVNKLVAAGLLDEGVDPRLDQLLARGVDPATAGELDLSALWPSPEEVEAYRKRAWPRILEGLARADLSRCTWDDAAWALQMGLEHERIHFETSSVLLRQLPIEEVAPPPGWTLSPTHGAPEANEAIEVEGGTVHLGRPDDTDTYGWDNEYGSLDVEVAPFRLGRRLVSNAELLEFVEAGGYDDPRFWAPEAWDWMRSRGRTRPFFWRGGPGAWRLRTVFQEIPLPLDWPAEVNAWEAEAWCRWAGCRLPTEAELVHARRATPRAQGDVVFHPDHHLALASCSPRPVDAGEPDEHGFVDMVGNVWQWLADAFQPLPGFRVHPLYDDFSEPYFGAHHQTLRGGAWATMGTGASEHYRLWFRPYFMQHAGFRPAWDA